MPEPDADATVAPALRRTLSKRRKFLFRSAYAGYLAGLGCLGERLFWKLFYGVPLSGSPSVNEVWDLFYPEIRQSGARDPSSEHPDGGPPRSVLLLGGSVLQQVATNLEAALRDRYSSKIRVISLAKAAHTSRDSYWKAVRLADRSFHLTIIYDGINDVRMNCCARSSYRDDYTHCVWYREFRRRLDAGRITIPELVSDSRTKGLALNCPTESELDLGLDVKTGPAFRRNLASIVDQPRSYGQKVVLMTCATRIPSDYTQAKFDAGGCGYGPGLYHLAAELWGRPQGIADAMAIHNQQIHSLAAGRDDVILVDQDRLLPKDGATFSDPCHLTSAGCVAFAANVVSALPDGLG